jgi:murein L,D-transpeptidase YafK
MSKAEGRVGTTTIIDHPSRAETGGTARLTRRTALALTGVALLAGCTGQPTAPAISSRARADHIFVGKSSRSMYLMRNGTAFRKYRVALGFAPEGHKTRSSDGRTPEGQYWIDRRNPRSEFFLSLGISYPSATDLARAQLLGVDPGGNIFIHGEPNNGRVARGTDWTAGCIAVTNAEMEEVWATVPTGIPITILA